MMISKYSGSAIEAEYFLSLGNGVMTFLWFDTTDTSRSISGTPAINANQWYHWAVDRAGTHIRLYLDGAVVAEDAASVDLKGPSEGIQFLAIGRRNHPSPFPLNGWLDEIRFTLGTARYQGAFTAPSSPFPRS